MPEKLKFQINTYLSAKEPLPTEANKTLLYLQSLVTISLIKRLIERRKSMELTCVLLESKAELKKYKQSATEIPQENLIQTLKSIKSIINNNFDTPNIYTVMPEFGHKILINALTKLQKRLSEDEQCSNITELTQLTAFYKKICKTSTNSEYNNLLKNIDLLIYAKLTRQTLTASQVQDHSLVFQKLDSTTTHPKKGISISQTTSVHTYQAFPSTPEGNGKWKKLKEQFCEPRTLDSSAKQDKFKLTKEKITVYRHKEKQASSIIASSVNDSTIKKIASIAYSMAKLTHNNIVMINNGSEKQIVALCKELDKFTRPKLIIKLSPTLMQNKSLLHALATTKHHHLRSSTKF